MLCVDVTTAAIAHGEDAEGRQAENEYEES
jgi:hypothetical protein